MLELNKVLDMGGEGLMLREAKSKYQNGRNKTLLKVKVFHDEEALVTGWENGTGRCADMMGKIHCELPNGIKFKIGTGFTDAQRKVNFLAHICFF
jgi:DNA ligase-1